MKAMGRNATSSCAVVIALTAVVVTMTGAVPVLAQTTNWINGMAPNWEQPYDYPDLYDPGGPGPWPGIGAPFSAWCTPTSAAMLIGHWEDRLLRVGVADGSADGNMGVFMGYAGAPWGGGPTWHDYCADGQGAGVHPMRGTGTRPVEDIGWYLDTNNIGDPILPNGPHAGTYLQDVDPGLFNYFTAIGNGVGQPAENMVPLTSGVHPFFGGFTMQQLCQLIQKEIDHNHTLLGHFVYWNPIGPPGPGNGTGIETQEVQFGFSDYTWGTPVSFGRNGEEYNFREDGEGLSHTVLIVGYTMDPQGNVTHLIVHDNWPTTVRNVRIPVGPELIAVTEVTAGASLGVTVLNAGQTEAFEVTYARPSTKTYLAYSLQGLGSTYIAALNVTLDLNKPKQAGKAKTTNANGVVRWNLPIPGGMTGTTVWMQACQSFLKTNACTRTVQ